MSVTIDVVDFTVLNLEGILWVSQRLEGLDMIKRHVVTLELEHRGFVHVIPSPEIRSRVLVVFEVVSGSPVFSGLFVEEVEPDTVSRPAFTNKDIVFLGSDEKVFLSSFFVDAIALVHLDVWVSNCDQLASILMKTFLHVFWFREVLLVPGEISASFSMIDIKSNRIAGNFIGVEAFVDLKNILLIQVGPSALVVSEREVLWHSAMSKDIREALEMSSLGIVHQNVAFQISSFTEPVGSSRGLIELVDVDVGIRGILPVQ